jgi:hypothetical protein
MVSAYVIMKQRQSPVYITEAKPHAVRSTRKAAVDLVETLNSKASENTYWVERVPYA